MKIQTQITTSILLCTLLLLPFAPIQAQRWQITPKTGGIEWHPQSDIPHEDNLEMSGEQVSCLLRWGIDNQGAFRSERSLIFPRLRVIPNNTYGQLKMRMTIDIPSLLLVGGLALVDESVEKIGINGLVEVCSQWAVRDEKLGLSGRVPRSKVVKINRQIFPSRRLPAMCERFTITNITNHTITLTIPAIDQCYTTEPERGIDGSYVVKTTIQNEGVYKLEPNDSVIFGAITQGYRLNEQPLSIDVAEQYTERKRFVCNDMDENLILKTPDEVINTLFRFCKIRASESIFSTRGGYFHSPGGEIYYAGIWTNDQAEYVYPFFPFLGYELGNQASLNSYLTFARYMNPEYKPIPSSIIAEGADIWNGVGDRGDAAMIAAGAARYALARGDEGEVKKLWPMIEWCLEYCHRKLTPDGVVASDTDELEGRFPVGKTNLSTSTLYYDALLSASYIARSMGNNQTAQKYVSQAKTLAQNIENFFCANINGYSTYRYYEGNTTLRSWISMPMIVGLKKNISGTVDALLGPELMTADGLLTAADGDTFWDRSTLYALRGIYCAGAPDRATEFLHNYSSRRLTGDHVPYPIEAWPENQQRHLSAESGLYCRILTEGVFGIRPTGLRSFVMTPHVPTTWNNVSLHNIRAFGSNFNIDICRSKKGLLTITVSSKTGKTQSYRVKEGTEVFIKLDK